MALIKCDECGGQISDRAIHCPHCGAPVRARSRAVARVMAVGMALLVGVLAAVLTSVRQTGGAEADGQFAPLMVAGVLVGVAIVGGLWAWIRATRR